MIWVSLQYLYVLPPCQQTDDDGKDYGEVHAWEGMRGILDASGLTEITNIPL